MFSKELEEVIEAALADGVLTEKERAVLYKRAQAEGVDQDELDVVIEGRLAKRKKEEDWLRPAPPKAAESTKMGKVMKCPNCGAPYQPGTATCPECGHVFQAMEALSSAVKFAEGLEKIQREFTGDDKREATESYIANFPIPSTKDDLLEFIAAMAGRRTSFDETSLFGNAYNAKLQEAINKARILFPNDPQFAPLIERYTKFSWENLNFIGKIYIICAGMFIFAILIGLIDSCVSCVR